MSTLKELEAEIKKIKERNARVEADKAWETSIARRGLLVIFTYLAVAIYLNAISIPYAWLSAIVPAVGFMLSTLTLPFFKKIWLKRRIS
jgi:hypothetical protein